MTEASSDTLARAARAMSQIERHELKATFASAAFVFILMTSYYVLRPVRDAMASDWTDSEVSLLWTLNFFLSATIVAVWGFAVSKSRLRHVVPALYAIFAATFVLFYFAIGTLDDREFVDKAFYLWVSVFALFHTTVFWTFMADTFRPGQARRLFGVIMVGSSAGALLGPAIPALFAEKMSVDTLMLIASLGLLTVIPLVFYISHLKLTELGNEDYGVNTSSTVLGGYWWKGFQAFIGNRFLLLIGAFILLYVFVGSFVYFEQKNLLADFSRAERTRILGSIDWLVNLLTFGMAFFLTGRIVRHLGMATALALVPMLMAVAMLILAFAPMLTVVLALQVLRRGGNYGLTRPAREMLYTRVSREERYKAKPVVDIVVYRGGDAVSGTLFALLTDFLGLSLGAVAAIGAGIAAVWAAIGIRLGRRFDKKEERRHDETLV